MFWCLVFKIIWAGRGRHQLHLYVEMAIESAVASSKSHINSHLTLSFQEVEWIPCGLHSRFGLYKFFFFSKADAVFRLLTSGSSFGELVCCLISLDSTMGRYPLQDYSSASKRSWSFSIKRGCLSPERAFWGVILAGLTTVSKSRLKPS